jgi:hypothetical protein
MIKFKVKYYNPPTIKYAILSIEQGEVLAIAVVEEYETHYLGRDDIQLTLQKWPKKYLFDTKKAAQNEIISRNTDNLHVICGQIGSLTLRKQTIEARISQIKAKFDNND